MPKNKDASVAAGLVQRIRDLVAQVERQRKALDQALAEAKALADRIAEQNDVTKR